MSHHRKPSRSERGVATPARTLDEGNPLSVSADDDMRDGHTRPLLRTEHPCASCDGYEFLPVVFTFGTWYRCVNCRTAWLPAEVGLD